MILVKVSMELKGVQTKDVSLNLIGNWIRSMESFMLYHSYGLFIKIVVYKIGKEKNSHVIYYYQL